MLRLLSKEVENTNSAPRNHQAPRGCCYVLLLNLPLHLIQQLICVDGLGGEAVVLPPRPDGGSGGQASRHPLRQMCIRDRELTAEMKKVKAEGSDCLLYTSPSPRD